MRSPWAFAQLAIAEAVEFESTIVHVRMLGIDEETARTVVNGLRKETSWSWERIREELTSLALTGKATSD